MMKRQEFYEKAQRLRDNYKTYSFKGRAVSQILLKVFNNEDEVPEEFEICEDVGYDYRSKYSNELKEVLVELGIEFDMCWSYSGEKFIIRGARFK